MAGELTARWEPDGAAPLEPGSLDAIPLLAGMDASELERVGHFMARFEAPAGERLFAQGEESDAVYLLEEGQVEIESELPEGRRVTLASLGAGELIGETSLLGGGRRSGTARVSAPARGWVLHRSGVEMLRLDAGEGSVELVARLSELVLRRLRARYDAIAAELDQTARERGSEAAAPSRARTAARAAAEGGMPDLGLVSPAYLEGLLCFSHFHSRAQIAQALGGAEPVELPAGAVALAAGAEVPELLLVLRGALDVSIRRAGLSRRVRLAGPGRFVGHTGALDGGPSPVTAHAREHVILLPLSARRVRAMLRDPSAPARRLWAGIAEDAARALRQAERPIASTAAAR